MTLQVATIGVWAKVGLVLLVFSPLASTSKIVVIRLEGGNIFDNVFGNCTLAGAECAVLDEVPPSLSCSAELQSQSVECPMCKCSQEASYFNAASFQCETPLKTVCPNTVGFQFRDIGKSAQSSQRQLLLINKTFSCQGKVVGWSVRIENNRTSSWFLLQVWRPNDSHFNLVGSYHIGVEASLLPGYTDTIYNLTAEEQILFQPGDVIGAFIVTGINDLPIARASLSPPPQDATDTYLYRLYPGISPPTELSLAAVDRLSPNIVANLFAITGPVSDEGYECVPLNEAITGSVQTPTVIYSGPVTHSTGQPVPSTVVTSTITATITPTTSSSSPYTTSTYTNSSPLPDQGVTEVEIQTSTNTTLTEEMWTVVIILVVFVAVFVLVLVVGTTVGMIVMYKRKCQTDSKEESPWSQPDNEGSTGTGTSPSTISTVSTTAAGLSYISVSMENLHRVKQEDSYWTPADTEDELYIQMDCHVIPRHCIKPGAVLGSGYFGSVHKGTLERENGDHLEVALKTFKAGISGRERVKLLQEAAIMGQFDHPNIVGLHGVVTVGEPLMVVLELMINGDLRKNLVTLRESLGQPVSKSYPHRFLEYSRHIASGMQYLSNKGFVHRDLAARNVFLDKNFVCKIGDFGMARDLVEEDYYIMHGGPIPVKWTAPEALNCRKYSTASDVWSYGVVLFEIWSMGMKPFASMHNLEVISQVNEGFRLPPPPGVSKEMYKLMLDCWHPESAKRPTFDEVVTFLTRDDTYLLTDEDEHRLSTGSTLTQYTDIQNTK